MCILQHEEESADEDIPEPEMEDDDNMETEDEETKEVKSKKAPGKVINCHTHQLLYAPLKSLSDLFKKNLIWMQEGSPFVCHN